MDRLEKNLKKFEEMFGFALHECSYDEWVKQLINGRRVGQSRMLRQYYIRKGDRVLRMRLTPSGVGVWSSENLSYFTSERFKGNFRTSTFYSETFCIIGGE